ncbi:hypothetical protein [Pseudobacteriovorax antillogorgiicola]|uniref:Uncharacterized protein n=1 Tax=Pseudobacteriovorax antillogorgiicola TaxID=1513793 RepID=A0A1Y6BZW5_9BACT|nr:hypothetical protein [Pseudobacteriovorax antillogorgiicola]TCS52379.1 hypothetical protein EDD56_109124 [Pseudobacteriovorax antillogorgiicola]SMF29267.1 hypothetical protein SAMN06296036_10989 [Pseudobacteriovorax antillogorgiicola]
MEKQVRIRIFDRNDCHLQDVSLTLAEAVYISPGKYLSDYLWSQNTGISDVFSRMVLSVGTAHEGLRDVKLETDYPWMSVWVDAV